MKTLRSTKLRLLALAAILPWITPPPAHADVTTNVSMPIDIVVFIPCAAGGAGELVELTGELHLLFATTLNSNGGFHVKMHAQPQGVSGIGMTTGAKYQGTGVTQEEFNANAGVQQTTVNNFRIIGQGPGNNSVLHENTHITVNPDGTVTANVDNFSTDCK
jgi:hypothetical protein